MQQTLVMEFANIWKIYYVHAGKIVGEDLNREKKSHDRNILKLWEYLLDDCLHVYVYVIGAL